MAAGGGGGGRSGGGPRGRGGGASMAFKKVESGIYENDTHRIFQDQSITYYTSGNKAMSRKDSDWVLVDKATRKVVRGIGTLKQAKQMAANSQG